MKLVTYASILLALLMGDQIVHAAAYEKVWSVDISPKKNLVAEMVANANVAAYSDDGKLRVYNTTNAQNPLVYETTPVSNPLAAQLSRSYLCASNKFPLFALLVPAGSGYPATAELRIFNTKSSTPLWSGNVHPDIAHFGQANFSMKCRFSDSGERLAVFVSDYNLSSGNYFSSFRIIGQDQVIPLVVRKNLSIPTTTGVYATSCPIVGSYYSCVLALVLGTDARDIELSADGQRTMILMANYFANLRTDDGLFYSSPEHHVGGAYDLAYSKADGNFLIGGNFEGSGSGPKPISKMLRWLPITSGGNDNSYFTECNTYNATSPDCIQPSANSTASAISVSSDGEVLFANSLDAASFQYKFSAFKKNAQGGYTEFYNLAVDSPNSAVGSLLGNRFATLGYSPTTYAPQLTVREALFDNLGNILGYSSPAYINEADVPPYTYQLKSSYTGSHFLLIGNLYTKLVLFRAPNGNNLVDLKLSGTPVAGQTMNFEISGPPSSEATFYWVNGSAYFDQPVLLPTGYPYVVNPTQNYGAQSLGVIPENGILQGTLTIPAGLSGKFVHGVVGMRRGNTNRRFVTLPQSLNIQ